MPAEVRPRVGVSSGLLPGHAGDRSRAFLLAGELSLYLDLVEFGPEAEAGLDPQAQAELAGLSGFVFASRAPVLLRADPLLPAEEDGRLGDPRHCEAFAERIFARARLLAMFAATWQVRDLVAFHTCHKLQLLSHDRNAYTCCGRLVAGAGRLSRETTAVRYRTAFEEALHHPATAGRQVDVLQHAFGMISRQLDGRARHGILAVTDAYGRGEVPLSAPAALISQHAVLVGSGYLQAQTYFRPYRPVLASATTCDR